MIDSLLIGGSKRPCLYSGGILMTGMIDALQMSSRTPTAWTLPVAFELPFATGLARHWVLSGMLPRAGSPTDHATGSLHHTLAPVLPCYQKIWVVAGSRWEYLSPSRRSGASMETPVCAKPYSSCLLPLPQNVYAVTYHPRSFRRAMITRL